MALDYADEMALFNKVSFGKMRNKAHFVFFKGPTTSFGVDFTTRNRCDLFLFFY